RRTGTRRLSRVHARRCGCAPCPGSRDRGATHRTARATSLGTDTRRGCPGVHHAPRPTGTAQEVTMRSLRIIARRELAQFFTSPIAYLVAFAILVLTGFMFNTDLANRVGQAPPDGTYVLGVFGFFTVFFAPLLTMRLFAEETREGTLELMLTMPVRDSDIVLGKFIGAWAYYSAILALTL